MSMWAPRRVLLCSRLFGYVRDMLTLRPITLSWDPPIALGEEKSIPLPTAPDSPPEYATPTSNPAMPALPNYAQPSVTPADDPSISTNHKTSKAAGRLTYTHRSPKNSGEPTSSGQNMSQDSKSRNVPLSSGDTVHAVRTTIITIPARNSKQTLTAVYGSHVLSLIGEGSTVSASISYDPVQVSHDSEMSCDPNQVSHSPDDPGLSYSAHQQVVTVGQAEYTVRPLRGEAFELIGQSTTVTIHQDDIQTTTSAGKLALATGHSLTPQNDVPSHQTSTKEYGDTSESSSGMRRALMTCVYLSLLAVSAAIFL